MRLMILCILSMIWRYNSTDPDGRTIVDGSPGEIIYILHGLRIGSSHRIKTCRLKYKEQFLRNCRKQDYRLEVILEDLDFILQMKAHHIWSFYLQLFRIKASDSGMCPDLYNFDVFYEPSIMHKCWEGPRFMIFLVLAFEWPCWHMLWMKWTSIAWCSWVSMERVGRQGTEEIEWNWYR